MPTPQLIRFDCGANRGLTLAQAIAAFPDARHIALEANPLLIPELHAVRITHPAARVEVHHAAVWTTDGALDFFLTDESADPAREGATLLRGKTTGDVDYARPLRIPSIDFDRFLRQRTRPDDTVIVKMDIEGAEYEVLEHLLDRGSINLIAALLVETHAHKIASIPPERHERLLTRLQYHFGRPFLKDDKHIAWSRPGCPSPALHVQTPLNA